MINKELKNQQNTLKGKRKEIQEANARYYKVLREVEGLQDRLEREERSLNAGVRGIPCPVCRGFIDLGIDTYILGICSYMLCILVLLLLFQVLKNRCIYVDMHGLVYLWTYGCLHVDEE